MRPAVTLSRREWLFTSSFPLLDFSLLEAAPRTSSQSLFFGIQLDALREPLSEDPDAALKAVALAGYTEVEGFSRRETLALIPRLKQYGLSPRSCVIETPLITADWENYPEFKRLSLEAAIQSLKEAGVEYCAMGTISPGARGDGDDFFRRTADRLNAAGELCRKAGMHLAWANQAFEFEGAPGLRPIDIYRDRLDPKLVSFEADPVWISVAKHDPVELMKFWKGRISLVRLRDKAKNSFAPVGEGDMNFAAILKTAQAAGARHFFVYDEPGNLAKALVYLKKLL